MPEIINNTPKATNDTSELALEIIMHKTPLTIQMAGTLLANTLKSNFIWGYYKWALHQMEILERIEV